MRKTFFEDKNKRLYFIHKRQVYAISEAKCSNLFFYLEINWAEIQKEYEQENKNRKEKLPITREFDAETYKRFINGFTHEMIMPISFSKDEIIVIFIEQNVMKAINKFEEINSENNQLAISKL